MQDPPGIENATGAEVGSSTGISGILVGGGFGVQVGGKVAITNSVAVSTETGMVGIGFLAAGST